MDKNSYRTRARPPRGQRFLVPLLLLAVVAGGLPGCGTVSYYRIHHLLKRALPASFSTQHFEIRYRPGSPAAGHVHRVGMEAERELTRICDKLKVESDARYTLFLFDDIADLKTATTVTDAGGFQSGDTACIVFDDDAARVHEIVHLVAHAKVGDSRAWFRTEGLANAFLDSTHGADMHAVAKYYRRNAKLPRLVTMLESHDVQAWFGQHPKFNGYDVAGSWMLFLFATFGPEKTKHFYIDGSATSAFGQPLDQLEKDWLAALDNYAVPPSTEARLALTDAHSIDLRHTRFEGESITADFKLSPPASDSIAFHFQWQKDGAEIPGATKPSLTIHHLSLADSGIYTLVIIAEFEGKKAEPKGLPSILLTVVRRPKER